MRTPLLLLFGTVAFSISAQNGAVRPTGAMRNTVFNGQLSALIAMDSITAPGMHGIGPLEYLRGELLLLDGHCFVSTSTSDSTMRVEERTDAGAPFFVQQHVVTWTNVELPDSVTDLGTLDAYLTTTYGALKTPFAFKLLGTTAEVEVHLVSVPAGTEVNGPDEVHAHSKHYSIADRAVEALGFFSTQHKAVFTHHDTNIHVHAITKDRSWMGHVEAMRFDPHALTIMIGLP